MVENNVEDGVSIIELIQIIWAKKIIIGVATIITAILAVVVVAIFINPSRTVYSSQFELYFPGIEYSKLPSGVIFKGADIIDAENLNKVNDDLNLDIDIDTMLNENYITISEDKKDDNSNSRTYTIQVIGDFFANKSDAKLFLSGIVELAYENVLDDIDNLKYDAYISSSVNSNTFEGQIDLLQQQKDYILKCYDNIISEFGDLVINGQSILSSKVAFEQFFINNNLSLYSQELSLHYYVKNYEKNLKELEINKENLNQQIIFTTNKIADLEDKIENILAMGNSASNYPEIDSYNQEIASLVLQKRSYLNELEIVENKINSGNTPGGLNDSVEFGNRLDELTTEIYSLIADYTEITKIVYSEFSYYKFTSSSIVNQSGGVNVMFAGVAGALLTGGSLSFGFVALEFYRRDKESKKNKEIAE